MSKTIEIPIPRIRTGYYGNLNEYKSANYSLIAISRTVPTNISDSVKQLSDLAPNKALLDSVKSGVIDQVEFEYEYRDWISRYPIEEWIKIISSIVFLEHTSGAVLLCYEKDFMRCHRSILADIMNKSGILEEAVEEY